MSNLKRDIEELVKEEQLAHCCAGMGCETASHIDVQPIINLMESVIPEEDKHTWRAYGQPDGTVVCDHCNVADDVNNLLLSQVADIKSKLIDGGEK